MIYKIRQALTVPSVTLTTLCWLLVSLTVYFYTRTLLFEGYDSNNVEKSKNIKVAIANDLFTGSYLRVRGQLKQFLEHTDMNLALIIDNNGSIVEHVDREENNRTDIVGVKHIMEYAQSVKYTENVHSAFVNIGDGINYLCVTPIFFQGSENNYFGKLIVVSDLKSLRVHLAKLLTMLLILFFVGVVSQIFILTKVANIITASIQGLTSIRQ